MIKKNLLFFMTVLSLAARAQVTLNVQLPPAGYIQKEQLWNIVLINNKEEILNVNVKLSIVDKITGQVMMVANTANFMLGKGVKIIKADEVQPVIYNYNNIDFSRTYLPMGAYIACYQVYESLHESQPLLGEECSAIHIDPLSPPLLNSPADKAVLADPYPQFTWMPPAPFDMFTNLNYDLLLVEVLPNQSAVEAIQYNMPVYIQNNLSTTVDNYPSFSPQLDTGKLYAWQVVAKNAENYAAKTEIWTFKIKRPERPAAGPDNGSYILLKDDVTGTYVLNTGKIHVKYFSTAKAYDAVISIYDAKKNEVQSITQKISPGYNYLDVVPSSGIRKGTVYSFVIKDPFKKEHQLRFSIK